ncbi:hypothetical protein CU633_09940 [Bacillus sp. V3-13]|nr:hypothetical protein CU633_09940 [Bacillus sp. V3-13]
MYDKNSGMYLMGWRDYDPQTGRFIVVDEYEGQEDEPTSLNRYLYADGDPVNNIDPDGHAPKWLQKGMKATKKAAKKAYNFAIGDDIKTLKSPKSKWYQKAGAAVSIASNFIPGAKGVTLGAKAAIKVGTKSPKLAKLAANSIKITRNNKLKNGGTPTKYRTIPKFTQPVAGDNVGSMLRGPGNQAHSSAQYNKLKTHYQQAEKYGKGGIKELSDGRIRYYGNITPATKPGEMAGRRVVREWNPKTGNKRTWQETVDHNGSIRQVRPDTKFTEGKKVHYRFDNKGKYVGAW